MTFLIFTGFECFPEKILFYNDENRIHFVTSSEIFTHVKFISIKFKQYIDLKVPLDNDLFDSCSNQIATHVYF